MGTERRYLHPSRHGVLETHPGSMGTSPWCPLSRTGLVGAHGRERREPEDEAAAVGDRAEGGCRGGGGCLDMSIHGTCVPAPPCFSLTQSPSQGRHKDTSSTVCACCSFSRHPWALQQGQDRDQLVPPCPAWAWSPAARRDAGSSQQVPKPPCFPLCPPRDGVDTLQTGAEQGLPAPACPGSTQQHPPTPQHPQQRRSHPTTLPRRAGPQGQHWVPCHAGGPAAGSLLPPQAAAGAVGFI